MRTIGIVTMLALMTTAQLACTDERDRAMSYTVVDPTIWPEIAGPVGLDPEMEAAIDKLLDRMSLEERVGQIIQGEIRHLKPSDVRKYHLGSVLNGGGSHPGNKKESSPEDWLALADEFWQASMDTSDGGVAIPIIWGTDAVHGHTNVIGATIFPHNIGLGAARNPELMEKIGAATAAEVAVTGLDWDFGPVLAVVRDDRWGRTYESYSEDPAAVSAYAGAMVTGMQGPVDSPGFLSEERVIATAKHFLADGGTTGGKDQGNTECSEAELRDIHGAGYFVALEAGVQTVMASFSSWNGQKMHGSEALLTDVLKHRLGFDGFIVGDWNAHGQVEGCSNTSCPAAINAGIDMLMAPKGWKKLWKNTLKQARSGEISPERLDDAVRRILRVKMRAGLFDRGRPSSRALANKVEHFGSAEHRAIARQAVRESLVLLKNNDGLLPLKPDQHILVAGDGADNIGKQSGGWTISWQGNDTVDEDFPGATSIWQGILNAVEAAGGTAELSPDGAYEQKPDVAIVVYGEEPYAEFQGDRETLDYGYTRPNDLKLLKKLQKADIPVASVFLSGRPLWVNPELNASDAFVAAWLPGSEGAGIADVIIRGTDGSVKHDFSGKLSFSWPCTAVQTPLNIGDPDYNPLFAYGFGLTYSEEGNLHQLAESAGIDSPAASRTVYFKGGPVAPWKLFLGDDVDWMVPAAGARAATRHSDNLVITAVDRKVQEDARAIRWAGESEAVIFLRADNTIDLAEEAADQLTLAIDLFIEGKPTSEVFLTMNCGEDCEGRIEITENLRVLESDKWHTLSIPLDCFADAGADLTHITTPFSLRTAGQLTLRFADIRLEEATENTPDCP